MSIKHEGSCARVAIEMAAIGGVCAICLWRIAGVLVAAPINQVSKVEDHVAVGLPSVPSDAYVKKLRRCEEDILLLVEGVLHLQDVISKLYGQSQPGENSIQPPIARPEFLDANKYYQERLRQKAELAKQLESLRKYLSFHSDPATENSTRGRQRASPSR